MAKKRRPLHGWSLDPVILDVWLVLFKVKSVLSCIEHGLAPQSSISVHSQPYATVGHCTTCTVHYQTAVTCLDIARAVNRS